MESLSEEVWDVVIAGTSLPQSLLSLALSKCGLKILHIDQNSYYGGVDAGLSLDEAERWVECQKAGGELGFSFTKSQEGSTCLASSRSYTIGLNPQIVYAKSKFLPVLVSAQLHMQLEFQAVGQFWILDDQQVVKIPSSREDVFADDSLSVRDKRRLMNLLRHVIEDKDKDIDRPDEISNLEHRLQTDFKIDRNLWGPVQALTRSTDVLRNTSSMLAMNRLRQHLSSLGYFGPGLAAVMAKYGGNAEIAQVACRAAAVSGAVYLLGHGIAGIDSKTADTSPLIVRLDEGTMIRAKNIVGMPQDLLESSSSMGSQPGSARQRVAHQVTILSDPLRPLFASSSDSGPAPAVAIVVVHSNHNDEEVPPVYMQVHSEDTGECPTGQCIVYASTLQNDSSASAVARLAKVTDDLIASQSKDSALNVQKLCTLCYITTNLIERLPTDLVTNRNPEESVIMLTPRVHGMAVDDKLLDEVKGVWECILGDRAKDFDFLHFDQERQDEAND